MKRLFLNGLIAAILTIASVAIFDGCKKNEPAPKTETSVKIQKFLNAHWVESSSSGTSAILIGSSLVNGNIYHYLCWGVTTRILVEDYPPYRVLGIEVIYSDPNDCDNVYGNILSTSIKINVGVSSHILDNPVLFNNMNYNDIANFELSVDDISVTPDFSYTKPFVFETTNNNGEIIAKEGTLHVTYDGVVELFHELSAQGIWQQVDPIATK